tara:strand:+ start:2778 stop:3347 length:570 start_codon:yes stop_codon:yes gene_type:complete
MKNNNFIKHLLVIISISALLSGCGGAPKIFGEKPIEPNARKRAQQNVAEGRGIQLFKGDKRGSGNFLFASSNPMWKAALDTLDFISIASSDYSGGVLITDWYSEGNPNEAIKITIRFLSNEIRADGMIINLYKRNCINNVCSTRELESDLIFDIKDKILKTAATYKEIDDKIAFENRPKKVFKDKDDSE